MSFVTGYSDNSAFGIDTQLRTACAIDYQQNVIGVLQCQSVFTFAKGLHGLFWELDVDFTLHVYTAEFMTAF